MSREQTWKICGAGLCGRREANREGRARAGTALDGDAAAHRLGQLANDCETQAGAVGRAAPVAAAQVEAVEGVLDVLGRDAGAGVGDGDRARRGANRDATSG